MADPSPTRLEEEVVEVMARALCCPQRSSPAYCKEPGFGPCIAMEKRGAEAQRALTAFLTLARERGWKHLPPYPSIADLLKIEAAMQASPEDPARAAYLEIWDAMPIAPWMEEKDA